MIKIFSICGDGVGDGGVDNYNFINSKELLSVQHEEQGIKSSVERRALPQADRRLDLDAFVGLYLGQGILESWNAIILEFCIL